MIRTSAIIAAAAILVSLILHLMGLSYTGPRLSKDLPGSSAPDAIELSTTFEDLAEVVADPVEPEPAEAPEPPLETPPETPEIPVSEALVASDNPQQVSAPDIGEAEVVDPVATEPVEPDAVDTDNTSEGDASASEAVDETPPPETETATEIAEGDPDAATTLPEVATEVQPVPPEPQELAALPVTPSPEAAIPVVPLETEAIDPDTPVAPTEPAPDPDTADEGSNLAVTSSIRPRVPDRRPTPERQGVLSGSRDFSELAFPEEIESPLYAYRREGLDAFTSGNSGSRSGGRGPGNSDTTNYAGKVLVHLNRAPVVFVSARGFAKVFFEINPDGTLAWVDIVDSSGSSEVERAARAQVRAASPFPLPPGGVSRKLSFFYTSN
ncbi:energy transducer TonB [Ruegeria sp. Ofav3-42]|uniref:energy transducer TonB family protein n=1 Tax=Ruegeria sp. Ofav3-42 TaxID=2917759 RepID=UPI001EF4A3BC|nr:energy transducer TonB [Ruegeria sp. Ofav3-42]MCG7521159.1 TonB family protein [Ruegeria sp. Ofav3-42]